LADNVDENVRLDNNTYMMLEDRNKYRRIYLRIVLIFKGDKKKQRSTLTWIRCTFIDILNNKERKGFSI